MRKYMILVLVLLVLGLFVISGCSGPVGKSLQTGELVGNTYKAGPGEKLVLDAENKSKLIILKEISPGGGTYQILDVFVYCGGNAGCSSPTYLCFPMSCTWTNYGGGLMSCGADCGSDCGGVKSCAVSTNP
ncbi:MAG: hypothetical protein ISS82_04490 [Nanoarchaeota archaeon]|nr:hypothetical protein [Nanoarchaeota archaeon]